MNLGSMLVFEDGKCSGAMLNFTRARRRFCHILFNFVYRDLLFDVFISLHGLVIVVSCCFIGSLTAGY